MSSTSPVLVLVDSAGFSPRCVSARPGQRVLWRVAADAPASIEFDVLSKGEVAFEAAQARAPRPGDSDDGSSDSDRDSGRGNSSVSGASSSDERRPPTSIADLESLRALGSHFTSNGGRRKQRHSAAAGRPQLHLSVAELAFESPALQVGRQTEFAWTVPDAGELRAVVSAGGASADALASLVAGKTTLAVRYSSSLWDHRGSLDIFLSHVPGSVGSTLAYGGAIASPPPPLHGSGVQSPPRSAALPPMASPKRLEAVSPARHRQPQEGRASANESLLSGTAPEAAGLNTDDVDSDDCDKFGARTEGLLGLRRPSRLGAVRTPTINENGGTSAMRSSETTATFDGAESMRSALAGMPGASAHGEKGSGSSTSGRVRVMEAAIAPLPLIPARPAADYDAKSLRGSVVSDGNDLGFLSRLDAVGNDDARSAVSGGTGASGSLLARLSAGTVEMTYSALRENVERGFTGRRTTLDHMARLDLLKARWDVSTDAGALAGRSSSAFAERSADVYSGARPDRSGSAASSIGSLGGSEFTRLSAATAPSALQFSTAGSGLLGMVRAAKHDARTTPFHNPAPPASGERSGAVQPRSPGAPGSGATLPPSAVVFLADTSATPGVTVSAGQSVEWRALSRTEAAHLDRGGGDGGAGASGLVKLAHGAAAASMRRKALLLASGAIDAGVSSYIIEVVRRPDGGSGAPKPPWSTTIELRACMCSARADASPGSCAKCTTRASITFEERGVYDWSDVIMSFIRGTIVVMPRARTAAPPSPAQPPEQSDAMSRAQARGSAGSCTPLPLQALQATPAAIPLTVAGKQDEATSTLSPSQRRRAKKRAEAAAAAAATGVAAAASPTVAPVAPPKTIEANVGTTVGSALKNETTQAAPGAFTEMAEAADTAAGLTADPEQAGKIKEQVSALVRKVAPLSEPIIKDSANVLGTASSTHGVAPAPPAAAVFRGPLVPWAQTPPDADPAQFDAWGKLVRAAQLGALAAGSRFTSSSR